MPRSERRHLLCRIYILRRLLVGDEQHLSNTRRLNQQITSIKINFGLTGHRGDFRGQIQRNLKTEKEENFQATVDSSANNIVMPWHGFILVPKYKRFTKRMTIFAYTLLINKKWSLSVKWLLAKMATRQSTKEEAVKGVLKRESTHKSRYKSLKQPNE